MNLELINGWTETLARESFPRCCGSSALVGGDGTCPAVRVRGGLAGNRRANLVGAGRGRLARSLRRPSTDRGPRVATSQVRVDRGVGEPRTGRSRRRQRRRASGLATGNRQYEERFGFIFIVCATGKTAEEMLALLRERLSNDPAAEIKIAAGEQMKITRIRLEKDRFMSPITSHVLDTSRGKPAAGIAVVVEIGQGADPGESWPGGSLTATAASLNSRPRSCLSSRVVYRLRFLTGAYFTAMGVHGFYPEVDVTVQIDEPAQHYHIPLLLSPFGYTTYRGS